MPQRRSKLNFFNVDAMPAVSSRSSCRMRPSSGALLLPSHSLAVCRLSTRLAYRTIRDSAGGEGGLITPPGCVLHVGRSGGWWVRQTLSSSGLCRSEARARDVGKGWAEQSARRAGRTDPVDVDESRMRQSASWEQRSNSCMGEAQGHGKGATRRGG